MTLETLRQPVLLVHRSHSPVAIHQSSDVRIRSIVTRRSTLVRSDSRVEEVLGDAERAGGTVVKPAEQAQWGGSSGYFADPDGVLWKVASGGGDQPFAE